MPCGARSRKSVRYQLVGPECQGVGVLLPWGCSLAAGGA